MWGVNLNSGPSSGGKEGKKLVHGMHVYGNLKRCNAELLKSEEYLRKVVEDAAKIGNMTLITIMTHKFGKDSGVSVVAIVAESHISIHTWPEYEYATVDVYTCGAHSNPVQSFMYIARALEAKEIDIYVNDRSLYAGELSEEELSRLVNIRTFESVQD
ncbi:MAG: adenosylmethionine decarboxylase [Crenarchaeota archaeon]|nr:adenosylmethionine decarboxylase [Thermoproteota archaeon]